ncbi:MAG: RraA family protein, partial [Gammaproteobacteria bacterium]
MSAQLRERLLALDSCALSDALDSLQLPAAVTGLIPLTVRRRIAGLAVTVRLMPEQPSAQSSRHLGTTAIEAAGSGDIIVIEHRSGTECAGWGGVLSVGAQQRKLGGVIIDGLARDVDEASQLGFPIFARGATARTARGRVWEVATNERVVIGDVDVDPGDWVLADSSGAVFIPNERIAEVL